MSCPRWRHRAFAAAGLVAVLALPACGSDDAKSTGPDAASSAAPTATNPPGVAMGPDGDAFYTPPDPLPAGKPGDLIWARPQEGPAGIRMWRILYLSTNVAGAPIAVSGMLAAPETPPAATPAPILSYEHGTTGLGDQCAPSRTFRPTSDLGDLLVTLTKRYVVVATDYEGLGTPGVHPYVVGISEAHSGLDAARAAQRFPGLGTSAASPSVVWGHSQGGGAALVSGELAAGYAPDINLKGVAAGAPASELKLLTGALRTSPYFGYLFMAAAGFGAAYPNLDSAAVFTPAGVAAATAAGSQCSDETIAAVKGKDPALYITADPGTTEPFATVLEDNSPGVRPATAPVFLYHGEADEQIPPIASQLVLDRYCQHGSTVFRKTYPGANHAGVVDIALPDIEKYLEDRLAGAPDIPNSCPPR